MDVLACSSFIYIIWIQYVYLHLIFVILALFYWFCGNGWIKLCPGGKEKATQVPWIIKAVGGALIWMHGIMSKQLWFNKIMHDIKTSTGDEGHGNKLLSISPLITCHILAITAITEPNINLIYINNACDSEPMTWNIDEK